MKTTIRRQLAFIFIGLMAGTILLCLFLNSAFLGKYYLKLKKNMIFEAYNVIRDAANNNYFSEDLQNRLDKVCDKNNIKICIVDVNSQVKYLSVNGGDYMEYRLLRYIINGMDQDMTILEQGDDYQLLTTVEDKSEYMEIYGRFESGFSFVMRTPLESIRDSAKIASRFFMFAGLLASVVGALIIWIVSRKITKPILELNAISEKMVHMDFEAKFNSKGLNEIDMLGENINTLSNALEESISELKTANNELKKDIEKKEQIDEMRKEFLSNVSHELKTPIALIQGYSEGLRDGISDDEQSREFYCNVIIDEAQKMNNMVKKLLTLNQLEFGNDVVNMERFDLVEMIGSCIQSGNILAQNQQVEIRMDAYQPIFVWADEFKTEEVFMNYFSNAIHHCTGDKYIEIKLECKDTKVRVSVFNTGEPIPEEALPHVWEKFYKVDKARTREYGGSGIGLSIVKAIMESMNQEFGAVNYSNGVLFWFELDRQS